MALGKLSDACHCRGVRTGRSMHQLAAASGGEGFWVSGGTFLKSKEKHWGPFLRKRGSEVRLEAPKCREWNQEGYLAHSEGRGCLLNTEAGEKRGRSCCPPRQTWSLPLPQPPFSRGRQQVRCGWEP